MMSKINERLFNNLIHNTVYNLVIMEAIDVLSSEQRDNSAIILQVQDNRLLWDKAQSIYKDHQRKAVTWNKIMKSVE